MKKTTGVALVVAGVIAVAGGVWAVAGPQHGRAGMHGMMLRLGLGHMIHDEANMPMLNGKDTTDTEVAELRAMFTEHTKITRTVTNLPDGIRTVTETEDPALREALVGHVVGMIDRVDEKRDPEIPIQSPTLSYVFAASESIVTEINPTDKGVEVIQTSNDPGMVAALQKHAEEVSDLAARGMQSVHESMMARN